MSDPEASSSATPVPYVPGVTQGWLEVNDVVIHYAEAGAGAPVVLLHGWPQNWYAFRHVIDALAVSRHVIALDLRGQGGSSIPRSGYDRATLVDDLNGCLDGSRPLSSGLGCTPAYQ